MENELYIPIHRDIDKETIKKRIQHVGVKGLSIENAEQLGLFSRISSLICAMHCLTKVSHDLYGQVDYLFGLAHVKKHEIKRACIEFETACDRWFKFWRGYQTVDGVREMNDQEADLMEQFMRWACLPVHWELGQPQQTSGEQEPMIEIEREDQIWRLYRDVVESELMEDEETEHDEWAVFRSDRPDGKKTMTCVERGVGKADVAMVAKRMSADDPGRLYVVHKLQVIKERRLEAIPHKAFYNGEKIGDIKKVLVKQKKKQSNGKKE